MKLVLVLLWFGVSLPADVVLGELTRGRVTQKSIQVARGAFTADRIDEIARAEAKRGSPAHLRQVVVYGAAGGPPLPKPNHVTYDYWRRMYEELKKSETEIAEITIISRDAVVRMRDRNGKTGKRVISGRDPLSHRVNGAEVEILHFGFSARSPTIMQRVDVYAYTEGELSDAVGQSLLGRFRSIFEGFEVSAYVRNDAWFIYHPTYPFRNPFIDSIPPPEARQLHEARTLYCRPAIPRPTRRIEP